MSDAATVETAIGVVGVEVTEAGVRRVRLPADGGVRRAVTGAGGLTALAAQQLVEYARGERQSFELPLDWAGVRALHRRVLETLVEMTPYGVTVTYGELGERSGVGDPREVGVLMATNPLPLLVPCHRVVAADGLGGYGGGLPLKRRLLELEGALPPSLDLGET